MHEQSAIAAQAPTLVQSSSEPVQMAYLTVSGEQKKLSLHVRELSLELEIGKQHLPKDVSDLLRLAVEQRNKNLEGKYNLVCIWIRLQNRGEFWKKFKCRSFDELLMRLDLPTGRTLGVLEVVVRLFDKETFLLVGDEALSYMAQLVNQHQKGVKQGLRAFQEIFDAYCAKYTAFDKPSFYQVVHWYVNRTFIEPQRNAPKQDVYKRPLSESAGGPVTVREAGIVDGVVQAQKRTPSAPLKPGLECAQCQDKDWLVKVAKRHIVKLEEVIRKGLGEKSIPKRPAVLAGDP